MVGGPPCQAYSIVGRSRTKGINPDDRLYLYKEYLRIIAISRIYLDNVNHIQASWFSEGYKTGQIALSFGADDFGGTLFDENVMLSAGFYNRTSVDGIKKLINEAGFEAVQRTTEYDLMEVTSKVV